MLKSEFQRALALFNAEQLDAAVNACLPYMNQPMFKLLLATCYGKQSRYSDAEALFDELLQHYPANVDVLFNFALVLKMQQRTKEAQQHLHTCLQHNPNYHPAYHALGAIAEMQQDFTLATNSYQRALSMQPGNTHYALSLAQCTFKRQDYSHALSLLHSVLNAGFNATALDLISAVFYKLKNTAAMRKLALRYEHELASQAEALKYAALLELDEKCLVKARNLLQQAQQVSISPNFEIDANLLYCSYLLKPSHAILQQLVELGASDGSADAYYFIVNILATLGELQQAEPLLQQAMMQYPNDTQLQLLGARLLIQLKQPQRALDILSNIKAIPDNETKLEICYQRVQVFEQRGDYALAAEQIKLAAKLMSTQQIVENLQQDVEIAKADLSAVDATLQGHARPLVFIIGFPRSGTTLLESKLAQCDNVKILEETNAVKQFYAYLLQLSAGENPVQFLLSQNDTQRLAFANQYLASLADYTELNAEHIIIDKMPLNALYLTPLLVLFPQARVVLMQRHPMDVCISSLKQRMINLFTVDDFAKSYDAYFSLLDSFERTFSDNTLVIKYEQLVSDYQNVFNQVLQHCGLSTANKHETDSPTMFNTPSYHQVNQPLYQKAVNSYQNYKDEFDFNHPILARWSKTLGY